MRRAAVQAFRTARRSHVRRLLSSRGFPTSPSLLAPRLNSISYERGQPLPILQSSMYFRSFTVALVSSLVASGAWFAYKGRSATDTGIQLRGFSNSQTSSILGSIPSNSALSNSVQPTIGPVTSGQATEATRRALVVENDQFFTGDLVGEEPLSKDTHDTGRMVLEMLTPAQATQKLRQSQESYLVGRGQGVVRYDVVQVASNNPIEDDHAEKIVPVPGSILPVSEGTPNPDWMFWGVFDGHSGWTTSAKLRQTLISFVARELNSTYKLASTSSSLNIPSPESIDAAIKRAFVRLDNEIVYESVDKVTKANSKRVGAEILAPALSGSCALLSYYDSRSKLLRVACTGDSRAVLGRRGPSGKWSAMPLSEDQTGGTPSEVRRLRAEHPGEEFVTRNGRILGQLEPSRAFGDAVYKWSKETATRMKLNFFGKTPSQHLITPPYVTAEPIVTTTQVKPELGDFLVMATDGLWECLTNEEVVGLVAQWLDNQNGNGVAEGGISSWFRSAQKPLPVENHGVRGKAGDGQRAPIRQDQWQIEGGDERFVLEDKNAATHLVRNALGGKNQDMVCALLTLPSPYSRRYRDDITVEVIFFGESLPGGNVTENIEASMNGAGTKSKL